MFTATRFIDLIMIQYSCLYTFLEIGGTVKGNFTVDGSSYQIIQNTRTNQPSINGTATFTQFFSIRQTPRKSGTISITKHFQKWEELGMDLGNMYEAKFLVEAGGGAGWFDASHLTFRRE